MRQIPGSLARQAHIDSLRLRLLAAVSGVTVSVACAGRSLNHTSHEDKGDTGGTTSTSEAGAGGSTGGTANATGGTTNATGGAGGSTGGTANATGGTTNATGGAGGTPGDTGGAINGGMGGAPVRGCVTEESYGPGLDYCEGSYVHRTAAEACEQSPRVALGSSNGQAGVPGASEPSPMGCVDDFGCTERPNGHCVKAPLVFGPVGSNKPYCLYSCTTDADCGSTAVCVCSPGSYYTSNVTGLGVNVGVCTSANCRTDADCSDDAPCVGVMDNLCGYSLPTDFHCQSPDDECSGPGDCGTAPPGYLCQPSDGHYRCSQASCGRPFLVAGSLRQSELVTSSAWLASDVDVGGTSDIDAASRSLVAAHWARAGLMEHASIAAFARFSLQLLALGAPATLVAAAARALEDETRHARACFALASRYAGHTLGPSPLDVNGALGSVELCEVVELVFEEGCLGETSAALEAAWAAELARDPQVREVLEGIAADEARHAELAFAFVAWAARQDCRAGERVATKFRTALASAEARSVKATSRTDESSDCLAAHGVLPASLEREARAAALYKIAPVLVSALGAEHAAEMRSIA